MRSLWLQTGVGLAAVLIASLVGVNYGQPDSVVLPDPERDDCIKAALCNLIKGDVMIESQGHPGPFYEAAIRNLQKSQNHKNCPSETIFSHCRKKRLECELDINIFARNTFGIPLDLLTPCPYLSWPFMLFNCQNYKNWPQPAITMIPEVCRSCLTQCYLVDEFEDFQRKLNLTDFPPNWERVKDVSKFIKSAIRKTEKRQGSEYIYPWAGQGSRSRSDVSEIKSSRRSDQFGTLGPEIICPPNHYIDAVEELFVVLPKTQYGDWHYSNLRFRCSEFSLSKEDKSKEIWTHELGQRSSKSSTCYIPGQSRFIVGMETTKGYKSGVGVNSTWQFSCRSAGEKPSSPLHCPPYTAACSVAFYYYDKVSIPTVNGYPLYGLNFGCCALPKIAPECRDNPKFTLEEIGVTCRLNNCSYKSNYGLLVNGVLNTTAQMASITLEHAAIFGKILTAYSSIDPMNVRHRFDWKNVPQVTRQLAIQESHSEILDSSSRVLRHQPTITCGKYVIYARDQLRNLPQSKNPTEEYLKSTMEGCTPGFHTRPKNITCRDAPVSSCSLPTSKCELCDVTFEYGIFLPRGVLLTTDEASKLYERLRMSYTTMGLPNDTYDWINVGKNPLSPQIIETITIVNKQREIAFSLGLPQIECGSGTIVAKNHVQLQAVNNGKYMTRNFKNGFVDMMMEELGCVPMYDEEGIDSREQGLLFFYTEPGLLNGEFNLQFAQTIGYELNPSIQEPIEISLKKLLQIAVEAKRGLGSTNARFLDWTTVASTPKVRVTYPAITVLIAKYDIDLTISIQKIIPTITCGGYKLYANFPKDIGCSPISRMEPILPTCTGCTLNPNFNSLPRQNYNLLYSGCSPTAQCTWPTPHGYENSNKNISPDRTRRQVEILASVGPQLTSLFHQNPLQPLNWDETVRVGGINIVNVPGPNGFDRAIEVPTIECGTIKMYSNVLTFELIKDL